MRMFCSGSRVCSFQDDWFGFVMEPSEMEGS